MKKFLLLICLTAVVVAANAQLQVATNMTSVLAGPARLLLNDRASVYNVVVTAPDDNVTVLFYDQNTVAAPYYGSNYVTSAYVSYTAYPSNIVTSYVGFNGVTNWYTNSYSFTLATTNAAATNAMSAVLTVPVSRGLSSTITTDALFTRGIVVRATTNANIVVNYRSGQ